MNQQPPLRNPRVPPVDVVDLPARKRSPSAAAALSRLKREIGLTISMLAGQLVSAVLWFLLLTGCGACLLVAGVFVLAGPGWSLIAAGVLCICIASFIRKGMNGG